MAKKRSAPKKTTSKKSKRSDNYVSFKLQPNERPFIQFTLTRQTLYWSLIAVLILLLGLYVIHLQTEISGIYDQIDTNTMQVDSSSLKK